MQNRHENGQPHSYKVGRRDSKHQKRIIRRKDAFFRFLLYWVAYCWKSVKTKKSLSMSFLRSWASTLRVPVRSSPRAACFVFWTAFWQVLWPKKCSVCHVRFEQIFDRFFWKLVVPQGSVTSLPGSQDWRLCEAEKLETSPHHHCNSVGVQTDVFCKSPVALSFFTDWAILRSCFLQSRNLHCPQTVETELALKLGNEYTKMHLEIDQIQKSTNLLARVYFTKFE